MSNEIKRIGQRATAAFAAVTLGMGLTVTTLLTPIVAHAAPTGLQVQSRAIYMSNATPGATSVSYAATFKPGTSTTIKGIILDFCAGSPIIGDSTCAAPSGFSISASPSVSTAALTAGTNAPISTTALGGTWTASSLNTNRTLKLVNSTGSALSTANTYGFVISTVTNPTQALPTTSGTFYARIITYTSDTGDIASYAPGTEGSTDAKDYGGFALSTSYNIQISAKVQESLTFCASGTDLSTNSNCGSATTPTLTLGHGTNSILDNTAVDGASAFTQASTNATSGLVIRMHATNSCSSSSNNAGLSANGGAKCDIKGTGGTTPVTITAGTTNFGLFVGLSNVTSSVGSSTGTITPDTNYNASGTTAYNATVASNQFGMDDSTTSGVASTYGDQIASSTGPVSQINNRLLFGATAGLAVPAGIYTGQESLIATGTF